MLRWDKHGVWLCIRRLHMHKGYFRWPRVNETAWPLTPDELNWVVSGVDWQRVKEHDLTKWVFPDVSGTASKPTITLWALLQI